jgi:LysR family glycine cleavage system transcriptional activator
MLVENVKASMSPPVSRDDLPRLELLRSFDAAARTLSFTRAAHELALTQSAVSRQIQQMEGSLGVALFERRHRALALTPAGHTMHRAVRDCLERLRDATASVRGSLRTRQVAVTTTPGFASLWLIPRLSRFSADHPQVDVLVSATYDVLNLRHGRIDVAVRFAEMGQGEGTPLFEESVVPVCAPRLLHDAARPLRVPADLVQHTLLVMDGLHDTTPMADWSPWLELMGLGSSIRGTNTLRFTSYTDAVAAAVAGQGVAIGRLPLVAGLLREGQLVAPFDGSSHSHRGYFVAASPRAAGNQDAREFIAWLHAEAQRP